MTSYILDTNTLLRLLLNDNLKQVTKVTQLLEKAKVKKIEVLLPEIVIFEIEFALEKYYKLPKNEVIEKLGVILSTDYLMIDKRSVFQTALELFDSKNISFVDCYLLSLSSEKKAKLFTFDKNLKKIS